jgi:hypothetical protein
VQRAYHDNSAGAALTSFLHSSMISPLRMRMTLMLPDFVVISASLP